jgi:hypothetical protein
MKTLTEAHKVDGVKVCRSEEVKALAPWSTLNV